MSQPRGRQGYAKGRAKREEIIDRATELFAEVGYNSASLREIAARCGITHPGLLHHFPSKTELLEAVLSRRDAQDTETFHLDPSHPRQYLEDLAKVVEHNASMPNMVELYTVLSAEATAADHPAHQYFVQRYAALSDAVAGAIAAGTQQGDFRADIDPVVTARALLALMDGLQVQWLLDPSAVDMTTTWRQAIACLSTQPRAGSAQE